MGAFSVYRSLFNIPAWVAKQAEDDLVQHLQLFLFGVNISFMRCLGICPWESPFTIVATVWFLVGMNPFMSYLLSWLCENPGAMWTLVFVSFLVHMRFLVKIFSVLVCKRFVTKLTVTTHFMVDLMAPANECFFAITAVIGFNRMQPRFMGLLLVLAKKCFLTMITSERFHL